MVWAIASVASRELPNLNVHKRVTVLVCFLSNSVLWWTHFPPKKESWWKWKTKSLWHHIKSVQIWYSFGAKFETWRHGMLTITGSVHSTQEFLISQTVKSERHCDRKFVETQQQTWKFPVQKSTDPSTNFALEGYKIEWDFHHLKVGLQTCIFSSQFHNDSIYWMGNECTTKHVRSPL